MDLINDASQNIADRLTWHTANRVKGDVGSIKGDVKGDVGSKAFYFRDTR